MTEVFVHLEGRTFVIDIEPNTINGLKCEFESLCKEDEVLKARRLQFAPTYSMFHRGLNAKVEIKRKYEFKGGEEVYVAWTPLQFGQSLPESGNDVYTTPLKQIQVTSSPRASVANKNEFKMNIMEREINKENIDPKLPLQENTSPLRKPDPSESIKHQQGTRKSIAHSPPMDLDYEPCCSKTLPLTLPFEEHELSDLGDDSHDDDWYGEVREYYLEDEWKKMPKALKEREKNRFELHEQQMKLGLTKTPFQPQKGEVIKPNIKHASKQKRTSSTRAPPPKRTSQRLQKRIAEAESSESIDDPIGEAGPSGAGKATSGIENTENSEPSDDEIIEGGSSNKKKRRPNTKLKFLPGDELVGSKLMPKFSDSSVRSILAGNPNMIYILADIRSHILSKRPVLYLSNSERTNMSIAIVKKYPQLADVDGDGTGSTSLSGSISASIRGKRSYDANTKPRRQAAKLQSKSKITGDFKIVCSEDESEEAAMNAELRAGTSDQIRVKFLIGRTLEIREVEFDIAYKAADPETRAQKCQEIWESYPHYKDGKLIIYEHCLHLKIKQEVMRDNFKNMVAKLSTFFNMGCDSGPDILRILVNLYEEITPKVLISVDKKITPPIDIRDEGEAEGRMHTKTYHAGHAPCVLATTLIDELGDEVLSRSYLKMYSTCLGTIEDPTPCEIVLQLLAPYFIGNINFPDAYKSFLRFLEKNVHGTMCIQTAKQSAHSTYTTFVRKYDSIK